MRTPYHIARITVLALAASMFVVALLTQKSSSLFEVLVAPFVGGLIVGIGTYMGCRWAPPTQRTTRLASALVVIYLVLGVVLTVPYETHAVKIDLPPAGAHTGAIEVVIGFIVTLIVGSALVLVPTFVARGVAAVCYATSQHDA